MGFGPLPLATRIELCENKTLEYGSTRAKRPSTAMWLRNFARSIEFAPRGSRTILPRSVCSHL